MFVFDLQDSVVSTLTFLNEQSGILTLLSILSAIGVFFYQQHNEKNKFNERIVNASKALIADLEGLEKSYSSGIFPKTTITEKKIDFSITSMGLEYYQIVVNSGLILYYGERTQFELSNLYYNMSLFNEWIKELNHVEFFSSLQGPDRILILDKIAQKLTNHEKEIKLKIPVVKILLYEEIKKFDKNGTFIKMWGSFGNGSGQFNEHHGIAFDSTGDVYIADTKNSRIQTFTEDGKYLTMWGTRGAGDNQLLMPQDIAIDSYDNVYLTDVGDAHPEIGYIRDFLVKNKNITQASC